MAVFSNSIDVKIVASENA